MVTGIAGANVVVMADVTGRQERSSDSLQRPCTDQPAAGGARPPTSEAAVVTGT
jgi:hypothetical protein